MQLPRMIKAFRRQVNPAAYSGVTDQISNAGQAAGNKASQAASGLSQAQLSAVIVFCIVGFVVAIAALFWLCSCSRRRKRAREMREKSEQLQSTPSAATTYTPASHSAPAPKRSSRQLGYSQGWGESRVALNSSFVASTNERYGWDQSRDQSRAHHAANPSMPRIPQPYRS